MSYDFAQERHEASLADECDEEMRYEAEQDAADDEERSLRCQSPYRCVDMSCGALDCSRCHPEGCDNPPNGGFEEEL